jgi:hypothetical protein
MATSSVSYLMLDAQYDPVFIPAVSLTGRLAVGQNILTRLNLWLGEWWEDRNLGLAVFQKILGQLASPRGQAAMSQLIQQQIQETPYVTSVTNIQFSFVNGKFIFTCIAETAFGQVTVTNQPAQASVI